MKSRRPESPAAFPLPAAFRQLSASTERRGRFLHCPLVVFASQAGGPTLFHSAMFIPAVSHRTSRQCDIARRAALVVTRTLSIAEELLSDGFSKLVPRVQLWYGSDRWQTGREGA